MILAIDKKDFRNDEEKLEMKNDESCLCKSSKVLIFSCSGGSNVGQLANQAAVELTRSGKGRLFCLAGIGAHHSGMIESSKAGDLLVAIDGCPVKCAQKTLEHASLKPEVCVVITELGIEKSHNLSLEDGECRHVVDKVGQEISSFLVCRPQNMNENARVKSEEGAGA
jgi:uncharacterized metal-binding protein